MADIALSIGIVREVEDSLSKDGYDGLRVRAELMQDGAKDYNNIPWAFPIMPKVFQTVPQVGEAVFVFSEDNGGSRTDSQRYYLGPIISQPQYNSFCKKENSTSLLKFGENRPIGKISNVDATRGSFPKQEDIAVVGRGREDVTLKYDNTTKASEIDLRAGIRSEPTNTDNKEMIGNIIFNDIDPAYIQLKYKQGLAHGEKTYANSIINMVADRINIMSNLDDNVSDRLHNKETLVDETSIDDTMSKLHQVPMGDKLVELLTIMKGCIMHHVHPWAGMEQCGDWAGFINKLESYDIESILSQYVRIS